MGACTGKYVALQIVPDINVFVPSEESKSPEANSKSNSDISSKDLDVKVVRKGQVFGRICKTSQYGFEDKLVRKLGIFDDNLRLSSMGVGYICKKGLKPDLSNLDDFFVIADEEYVLVGVFDGHGPFGQEVANYAQSFLSANLLAQTEFQSAPASAIMSSFLNLQVSLNSLKPGNTMGIDCTISGTTATLALVQHSQLTLAYVGDSQAILATGSHAENLTPSHIPSLEGELERILASDGEVRRLEGEQFDRVFIKGQHYPGISISRTLGNSLAQSCGVSSMPTIIERPILQETALIVCSDGIWEHISEEEAAALAATQPTPQQAAHKLAAHAWQRWMDVEDGLSDDISVVIVSLDRFKP